MPTLSNFDDSTKSLEAEIKLEGNKILVSFQLMGNGFADKFFPESSLKRKDELWKSTCFEAFWSEPGSTKYCELNFNQNGEWNIYEFASYRLPQPPVASNQYKVTGIFSKDKKLNCAIEADKNLGVLEASLTCILKVGEKTLYFATRHCGEKPDFHLRDSFILKVGLK